MNKLLFLFLLLTSSVYANEQCTYFEFRNNPEITSVPKRQIVMQPGRTYFYSDPTTEGCKEKSLFIIKGDVVNAYAQYNGFTHIEYYSKKGILSSGWIKSSAITPYDPEIALGSPIRYEDFAVKNATYHFALDDLPETLFTPIWQNDLTQCIDGAFQMNMVYNQFSYDDLEIMTSFNVVQRPLFPIDSIDQCTSLNHNNSIFAITLFTNVYKTPRGISVLSTKKALFAAYPQESLKPIPLDRCGTKLPDAVCYDVTYQDNLMRFILDKDGIIRTITMTNLPSVLGI